ncbi:hypothetical protein OAO01_00175 [Oligoflexia bacterium]|nr:hypothetical protein [Oligoflexia bacterium]
MFQQYVFQQYVFQQYVFQQYVFQQYVFQQYIKAILFCLIVLSTASIMGCTQPPTEDEASSEPKTFYGQTVKGTKDLSKQSTERDNEVTQQAEALFDE